MMVGGFKQIQVDQDHIDIFNNNSTTVNDKLGINNDSWTVNAIFSQVVAGRMLYYHVTASNGQKYSATIFVPLPHTGKPPEVKVAEPGHNNAKNPCS